MTTPTPTPALPEPYATAVQLNLSNALAYVVQQQIRLMVLTELDVISWFDNLGDARSYAYGEGSSDTLDLVCNAANPDLVNWCWRVSQAVAGFIWFRHTSWLDLDADPEEDPMGMLGFQAADVASRLVLVGEVPSDDVLGLGRISASMWFGSRLALYGVEVES